MKEHNNQNIDALPLVSREQLSEEDHNLIVQKIVNGDIATKEEIQECVIQVTLRRYRNVIVKYLQMFGQERIQSYNCDLLFTRRTEVTFQEAGDR